MRATVTRPLATRTTHGGPALGLALGFASHVLAGLSPFIVAAVIARTALLPGRPWSMDLAPPASRRC